MKKALVGLAIALVLVAAVASPAMATEDTSEATVTVTEYVSVTFTDHTPAGLQFGNLNPGTVKQAEANTPAITITTAVENNSDVDVFLKGTDFSDSVTPPNTFTIDNAFYHNSNTPGSALAMTSTYPVTAWKTLGAGATLDIYHWLSIPAEQAAASYTSTFTYKTQAAP